MNIASIDIGSNTVLLLIAKIDGNDLLPVANYFNTPRLGKGLSIGGNISEDRILHLFDILNEYKKIIKSHNCKKVIVTATNAMRIASNSDNIVAAVKSKFNFDVDIITGLEEAKLSFIGASSSQPSLKKKVVIDIGGGSTEIIFGSQTNIFYKNSFDTGVVSLTEKYLQYFPYSPQILKEINDFLNILFKPLVKEEINNIPIIAVAGTPTTLSCINQNIKEYDETKVEGSILKKNDLSKLKNNLKELQGEEILDKYGQVVNGREDVIFAGAIILDKIREIIHSDIINVSSRGIRYGSIYNYMLNAKL